MVRVMFITVNWRIGSCASFFFQAEDGIRDLVRSRGLGDVYKRQRRPPRSRPDRRRGLLLAQPRGPAEDARVHGRLQLSLIHI